MIEEVEKVHECIKEFDLLKETRKPEVTNKRFFLYGYLKHHTDLSYEDIAIIFNQDRTNVYHAVKRHKHWIETNDEQYMRNVKPLLKHVQISQEISDVDNLREAVLLSSSLVEFYEIKERIKAGTL